ncbi:MAG: hypothetical protein QMC67_13170 [Candidatus Wallbacteria bacterium]
MRKAFLFETGSEKLHTLTDELNKILAKGWCVEKLMNIKNDKFLLAICVNTEALTYYDAADNTFKEYPPQK